MANNRANSSAEHSQRTQSLNQGKVSFKLSIMEKCYFIQRKKIHFLNFELSVHCFQKWTFNFKLGKMKCFLWNQGNFSMMLFLIKLFLGSKNHFSACFNKYYPGLFKCVTCSWSPQSGRGRETTLDNVAPLYGAYCANNIY